MSTILDLMPLPANPGQGRSTPLLPTHSDRSQASFDDRLAEANSHQSTRETSSQAKNDEASAKFAETSGEARAESVADTDDSENAVESSQDVEAADVEQTNENADASDDDNLAEDEIQGVEPEVRLDYELIFETQEGQAVVSGTLLLDPSNPSQALATPASILGDLSQATGAVSVSLTQTPLPGSGAATIGEGQSIPADQAAVIPEASVFNQSAEGDTGQADTTSDPNATKPLAGEAKPGSAAVATPSFMLPTPGIDQSAVASRIDPSMSAAVNPTVNPDQLEGDDAINTARITRGISNAVNQQGGSVTLRLTPPEMGTVRIQLQMQGANVSAQFHAETESAKTLLTQQLHQLRSSLESAGLSVDKIGVQTMNSSNSSNLQQQSDQSQQQAQDHSDGRSRGRFGQRQNQGQQQNPGGSQQDNPRFRSVFDESTSL